VFSISAHTLGVFWIQSLFGFCFQIFLLYRNPDFLSLQQDCLYLKHILLFPYFCCFYLWQELPVWEYVSFTQPTKWGSWKKKKKLIWQRYESHSSLFNSDNSDWEDWGVISGEWWSLKYARILTDVTLANDISDRKYILRKGRKTNGRK
jgi:hypothetical protein